MTSIQIAPADPLSAFHPATRQWFRGAFSSPTAAQSAAWPAIHDGQSVLVAAPTGSGKTLTAFLAALDALFDEGVRAGGALPDETRIIYVSPLKALSNDIRLNLERPLQGISETLGEMGMPIPAIRTAVRTGDTPQKARDAMRRRQPHVLVTTPESLYVLLGSDSGRAMLATARTLIVDEIHAVAGGKRGSHLALSAERLEALCQRPLQRIGLSATQKPIDAVARFLVGRGGRRCEIVDIGHSRPRDLALELPPVPLEAVMSNDLWDKVYDRLAELVDDHRTTLVFVNTRRMAERAARHLADRLGTSAVAAHHGSLAREQRLDAEQRLKRGELRVLIATASLELGIDIGEVDLVCQLGSPGSISAFLQRVGRSGHHIEGTPKGRLFPSSRDDLIECVALLDCVRRGELDQLQVPEAPLDVLSQQIVAEIASQEWEEGALLAMIRRAEPYAALTEAQYQSVLAMLAEGYSGRQGVRAAYLHRDAVSGTLRGRRGGKLTAVSSGGTIPDNADYSVLLEPQGQPIGTVNEDFAVESLAGDVFQLGNTSYRILKIESGRVRVEDARGQPPNIPFWLGEAPGRSDELSASVARLRGAVETLLRDAEPAGKGDGDDASLALHVVIDRLREDLALPEAAARQIVEYLARSYRALGALPTRQRLVMERFFDESGGTQLVIHSPYGSRINRAWGLALRKRFCRTFNFELQAAATEDAIVLSLSTSHSFPLDDVWRYLNSRSAETVLVQALLDAPLFGVRWRWNAVTALALPRMAGGKKVAPQLQRMRSEDLLATVFPDQVACLENIVGERQVPDHPLVAQTLDDCLHEAMDSEGWLALLGRMERGEVTLLARDLPAPSPLAMEVLGAKPYSFLDDAPLEERRTQAVLARRWSDPASTDDLGALDAKAIETVAEQVWPRVRSDDEMHEALMTLAAVATEDLHRHPAWTEHLVALAARGRATCLTIASDRQLWVALERLGLFRVLYPNAPVQPALAVPAAFDRHVEPDEALVEVVRARLSGLGPTLLTRLASVLAQPASAMAQALIRLETEGYVLRGRFTPGAVEEEWCERQILARIHRQTLRQLRQAIQPVSPAAFMRFLFRWQRVDGESRVRGPSALSDVLSQLEGFQAGAAAWEADLLPARVVDYHGPWLDELCRSGRMAWLRLAPRTRARGGPVRGTPIVLCPRAALRHWRGVVNGAVDIELSGRAARVREALQQGGASFYDDLLGQARLLPSELDDALAELVAVGQVTADAFAGLRALLAPAAQRSPRRRGGRVGFPLGGMAEAGRWSLLPAASVESTVSGQVATGDAEALEHVARVLLRRYGVVGWRLLEREADWLPPWRDLLRVYHRLEARGEVRGGRFIDGLSGQQFALPEAIGPLRQARQRPDTPEFLVVSATDPLNLAGLVLPGDRVAAQAGNRLLFRDGEVVATLVAGDLVTRVSATPFEENDWRQRLARRL